MTGGQLQMVPLLRIGDAASRQKCPPQERRPAAVLLQYSEVHVQRCQLPRIIAQCVDDLFQLFRRCDAEDQLSFAVRFLRYPVEFYPKSFLKQLWQPCGEVSVLRDDPYLSGRERVAVQQHTVALSPGAALAANSHAAQLIFYLSRK